MVSHKFPLSLVVYCHSRDDCSLCPIFIHCIGVIGRKLPKAREVLYTVFIEAAISKWTSAFSPVEVLAVLLAKIEREKEVGWYGGTL
jgi:hypothetical protein